MDLTAKASETCATNRHSARRKSLLVTNAQEWSFAYKYLH